MVTFIYSFVEDENAGHFDKIFMRGNYYVLSEEVPYNSTLISSSCFLSFTFPSSISASVYSFLMLTSNSHNPCE